MQQLRIYSSTGDVKLADLALSLHLAEREVVLLPLTKLPPPLPGRLGPLRLEQAQLKQQLVIIEWRLEQLASGQWQPDAGLENGLRAEHNSLSCRLRGVETSIAVLEKGGQDNG